MVSRSRLSRGRLEAMFQRIPARAQEVESQALGTLEAHRRASEASTELGLRVAELANRAHGLWLRQDHAEREKLLPVLSLNLTWTAQPSLRNGESPSAYSPKGSLVQSSRADRI